VTDEFEMGDGRHLENRKVAFLLLPRPAGVALSSRAIAPIKNPLLRDAASRHSSLTTCY